MATIFTDRRLIPFWFSFPEDKDYPIGVGVTAFNVEDAVDLLEEFEFFYHKTAIQIKITENVKWDEIPYAPTVHPKMGPIVVRGIWYPHLNSP
jgi:hypothetical protein